MVEFILLVTFSLVVLGALVAIKSGKTRHSQTRTYELSFSRGIEAGAVEGFVNALTGLRQPHWRRHAGLPLVGFEIHASHERITFWLHVEAGAAEFVVGQLRASLPKVGIKQADRPAMRPSLSAELRLAGSDRMLRVDRPTEIAAAILAALRPLTGSETLLIQWMFTPVSSTRLDRKQSPNVLAALFGTDRNSGTVPPPDKSQREKMVGPHFDAVLRLGVSSQTTERDRHLMRRLLAVWHIVNAQGVSFRRRLVPNRVASTRLVGRRAWLFAAPCFVNARELAAVLGIPTGELVVAGLELRRSRELPVSATLPTEGAVLATSNFGEGGKKITFGLRSLPFNAWIGAGTGAGKSTLLLHIIHYYMGLNATIVIFDPKRDLVNDATNIIPPHRVRDLVLIDPADDRPIGVNLLAGNAASADLIADQITGIFPRLWPGYVGPRSLDLLRCSAQTLIQTPGMTLLEMPLLLLNESFRRRLVSRLDDPIVLEPMWAAFESASPADRNAMVQAPINKLRAVLGRRALRDIVGQAQGLDIADVLSRKSILMVSLSKGVIGADAASLLGSLVLLRIWQVLSARAQLERSQRTPVLIVLDELADYMRLPMDFGEMLSQCRALGVGVVAAGQHLGQLPKQLRLDLAANARTKIAFQLSAPDARVMAQEFAPFVDVQDLQALGRFEIAAQVCVDGEVLPPATGVTNPPPEPTGMGDKARAFSREHYGRDRAEIESEIRRRHGEQPGSGSVGQRRRS